MAVLQQFSATGPVGKLEGIAHVPDAAPSAIAVVAHPLTTMGGTMENKVVTTLAKVFAGLDCAALRFNFRGAGASEGAFDKGDGETNDLLAVAEYARQAFGELPLILSGFSFGGYVAARAAEVLHPRHLALVAPAVGRFAMPQVPSYTLLIHGEHDEVVPLADVLHWARPQHLPVVVLPGTDHFFHGRLKQIETIVQRHFTGLAL